jgi:hypothetical protein
MLHEGRRPTDQLNQSHAFTLQSLRFHHGILIGKLSTVLISAMGGKYM